MTTTEVPVRGKIVLIDTEDLYILNNGKHWGLNTAGYPVIYRRLRLTKNKRKCTEIKIHRLLTKCPPGLYVDHINHDILDARKANLRICTPGENAMHARKQARITSSKYKGVSWLKKNKVWVAYLSFKKERIYLGSFKNEIEAAAAYDEAVVFFFYDFAVLNFPKGAP